MAKKLLRTLRRFVIFIVALVTILLIAGFFLPTTFDMNAVDEVQAHPSSVYHYLSSPRTWVRWGPWNPNTMPGMRSRYEGPSSGVGARWTWDEDTLGKGYVEITETRPYTHIAYQQEHDAFDDVMRGVIRLEPTETGTMVHWNYKGSLGTKPWLRWVMLLFKDPMREDFVTAIKGLNAHLNTGK
jgi:hypothetical protein